jgi:hypothetical protein
MRHLNELGKGISSCLSWAGDQYFYRGQVVSKAKWAWSGAWTGVPIWAGDTVRSLRATGFQPHHRLQAKATVKKFAGDMC